MVLEKFKLTDQVAVVTGAGRGVGKGIAMAFAEAGASVVCAARTGEQIEATANELRSRGYTAMPVITDVRDVEQVENLVQRTVEEFGRLDIMVNNAGGTFFSKLMNTSLKGFEAIMRENLLSCFICSQFAARVMIEQNRGNIINISSRSGQLGTRNLGHYAAAKAGVNNLTQTLAWELAPHNIRVNCLCLGPILTENNRDFFMKDEERNLRNLSIKRFGLPEDVAAFSVFLASDASSWITGKIYELDGGLHYER
jgi:7-alpha-hydroxysteroid dehydrogenase